ncbi:MAG: tripartite tricarboxylate transporter TctB family protein [Gemmatimonadales bacterium]|nr:tripartite tricarboxylate transporter TctB family protein [Gemmatimonadales bacterium]
MKRWDERVSVIGVVLGVLVVVAALRMPLGAWSSPGPAFLPVGAGVLLVVLCLAYGINAWRNTEPEYSRKPSPWVIEHWRRAVSVMFALLVYALLLDTLGYLVATFLLMVVLLRVLEPPGWPMTFLAATLITAVTYIVFGKWLMVQFPRGIFGV